MKTITFISVGEAAKIAGVSSETIRNLCKAGTISYQKKEHLFYPCKEDVNRYTNSISKVHSIRKDIDRYTEQLNKEREKLKSAITEAVENSNTFKNYNFRTERMQEIMYALLRQYEVNRVEDISKREVQLLFSMLRGETYQEAGKRMSLTGERVRQIWQKILRKLIAARNEIELRDNEIRKLKQQIKELEGVISNKKFDSVPWQIVDNIDLLGQPLDNFDFCNRLGRTFATKHIQTVFDLVQYTRREVYMLPCVGAKSIGEIDAFLAAHNLSYGMSLPDNVTFAEVQDYFKNKH